MKDKFISFVRENPSILDYVKRNNISWQSLYEVYTMYGDDKKIWDKYLDNKESSVDELVSMIKKVNLESIRKVVDSLQKTLNIVQDIAGKEEIPYEKRTTFDDADD